MKKKKGTWFSFLENSLSLKWYSLKTSVSGAQRRHWTPRCLFQHVGACNFFLTLTDSCNGWPFQVHCPRPHCRRWHEVHRLSLVLWRHGTLQQLWHHALQRDQPVWHEPCRHQAIGGAAPVWRESLSQQTANGAGAAGAGALRLHQHHWPGWSPRQVEPHLGAWGEGGGGGGGNWGHTPQQSETLLPVCVRCLLRVRPSQS